jgi:hypothetical protein
MQSLPKVDFGFFAFFASMVIHQGHKILPIIIPNLHVNGLFNANCKVYPHENQPTYTVMKKLNSKLTFCNQRTVLKFCSVSFSVEYID